jgi:hypothetical protein
LKLVQSQGQKEQVQEESEEESDEEVPKFLLNRGRHCMVDGFTTACAITAYQQFEPHSWQGVLDATLCDKVCQ